jgi:hypothetical protein
VDERKLQNQKMFCDNRPRCGYPIVIFEEHPAAIASQNGETNDVTQSSLNQGNHLRFYPAGGCRSSQKTENKEDGQCDGRCLHYNRQTLAPNTSTAVDDRSHPEIAKTMFYGLRTMGKLPRPSDRRRTGAYFFFSDAQI